MMAVMAIFMTIPIMLHRHYWLLYGLGLTIVELIRRESETAFATNAFTARLDAR
jgi:hypothetical protein